MQVLQMVISGKPSRSASARMRKLSVKKPRDRWPELARAGAGRRFELRELEPELCGDPMRRLIELGAGAAGRAARIIGKLHASAHSANERRRAACGRES